MFPTPHPERSEGFLTKSSYKSFHYLLECKNNLFLLSFSFFLFLRSFVATLLRMSSRGVQKTPRLLKYLSIFSQVFCQAYGTVLSPRRPLASCSQLYRPLAQKIFLRGIQKPLSLPLPPPPWEKKSTAGFPLTDSPALSHR